MSGVTTMIGGGTACGRHKRHHLHTGAVVSPACCGQPIRYRVNIGLLGKGNGSNPDELREQNRRRCHRARSTKTGATPAAINRSLEVAEEMDIQVALHSDTLNESGFVGRHAGGHRRAHHPHLPHRRGGGGHAPDIITACAHPNILPSLHQPDAALHGQHHRRALGHADGLPSPRPGYRRDVAFAESAFAGRPSPPKTCCTISARSRSPRRIHRQWAAWEVIIRTWRVAHRMKEAAARHCR